MALLRVVGFDPSLRNWGIAAGLYCTVSHTLTVKSLEVICAELPDSKQVRVSSKDLESAYQLRCGVQKYLDHAQVVFVEMPSGSQSASGAKANGICYGVLGSIRANGHPFFELTAKAVKVAATGNANATKQQMIDWAVATHPEAPWPTHKKAGQVLITTGTAEHMADATAAIRAGVQSHEFKQFLNLKL